MLRRGAEKATVPGRGRAGTPPSSDRFWLNTARLTAGCTCSCALRYAATAAGVDYGYWCWNVSE